MSSEHDLGIFIISADINNLRKLLVGGGGTISFITNLLWHILADPDRNLLMDRLALLSWYLCTLLLRLRSAHLIWYIVTSFSWYISTALFRNISTLGVGHLSLLGLGYILALVIGVRLAGARYGDPDLVVALPLPVVLTVLFILGGAFCLCVGLILCPVLVNTNILIHSLTLLLIDSVTLKQERSLE